MSIRLYADQLRCAIYEEAPGGGDALDPNSLMNRPVISPVAWLDNIYFHSDFDYYGTFIYQPSILVDHPVIPGIVTNITTFRTFEGQAVRNDHLLVQHNLGYVPNFFVIYNGRMIPHGTPVQSVDSGRQRFVTAYATTTQIRLSEVGYSNANSLAQISINYGVMVFANPNVNPAIETFLAEPGNVIFGKGKFRMEWPHLRVVGSGDSPFAQATSATAGIGNGGIRVWPPNDSAIDFNNYSGSFSSPPAFINVSAGV